MLNRLRTAGQLVQACLKDPQAVKHWVKTLPANLDGFALARDWVESEHRVDESAPAHSNSDNPLWKYFQNHRQGRGIWKWEHYFFAYHRHLSKFMGRAPSVVEVGVYSGGSLDMWKDYFGSGCRVHGIDIESACRAYATDDVTIHIGDQEDRGFWRDFRASVPQVDVLIDDGGHTPEQQIVTLEEVLPNLRPGGVYVCEDIHGLSNRFDSYVSGLSQPLHHMDHGKNESGSWSTTNAFQRDVSSIHHYPFLCVIEMNALPRSRLAAPKHGTEWQPYL